METDLLARWCSIAKMQAELLFSLHCTPEISQLNKAYFS
jgi:hypothetical protein